MRILVRFDEIILSQKSKETPKDITIILILLRMQFINRINEKPP